MERKNLVMEMAVIQTRVGKYQLQKLKLKHASQGCSMDFMKV